MLHKITSTLSRQNILLEQASILILGCTDRLGICNNLEEDMMNTMIELYNGGAKVNYHDPLIAGLILNVKEKTIGNDGQIQKVEKKLRFPSVPLTAENLSKPDCVVLTQIQPAFDMIFIIDHAKLIIDVRKELGEIKINEYIFTYKLY